MTPDPTMAGDRWAAWLLDRRFGGDSAQRDAMLPALYRYRDEVLRRAAIRPGDVVLDVGCGDGLIGFGAADLVGPFGRVVFSDVSADLLAACRDIAASSADPTGTPTRRFAFVQTGLPALDGIASNSVDVATTRSVLIYVDDIAGSFTALHRVLRPGGRLSLFEPINRFGRADRAEWLWGFDMSGLETIADKVRRHYEASAPGLATMLAFDERDLLRHAEVAGFVDLRLTYAAEVTRHGDGSVDGMLRQAPNPLVPPLGEIVASALTPPEEAALRERFAAELAAGRQERRMATAYLSATRD
jgi:ubiquinone/menaquinone biosynthesis C-methylase UbiE